MPVGNGTYSWILVSDPLDIGGFDTGTKFNIEEIFYMLRTEAFTNGTILRHRIHGKFRVETRDRSNNSQILVNSKYVVKASSGQNLEFIERMKQKRGVVQV